MANNAISIEHDSKRYRLGANGAGSSNDTISRRWARLVGRDDPTRALSPDAGGAMANGDFWAVKDVSLQIRDGEVLGLIGRNGAGKSTLLKLISQVTSPTTGRIRIRGRVASLLEV